MNKIIKNDRLGRYYTDDLSGKLHDAIAMLSNYEKEFEEQGYFDLTFENYGNYFSIYGSREETDVEYNTRLQLQAEHGKHIEQAELELLRQLQEK